MFLRYGNKLYGKYLLWSYIARQIITRIVWNKYYISRDELSTVEGQCSHGLAKGAPDVLIHR